MPLTIFCDESGYSGGNLFLDKDRYFVYASVAIANDEAIEIVKKIRTDSRTQASELKFENLGKTPRGRAAVKWFLETHGEKVAIFHADKRFSTAAKFFEYTFEPVLRPKKPLFVEINFHRFISMLLFDAWAGGDPVARELLEDGQNLVRFNQPEKLTRLLREPLHRVGGDDPLTAIAACCYAYRTRIMREIKTVGADPDLKRWTMDISNSALLVTFLHWGEGGEELEVYCDESKPLMASAEHMREMATTPMPEEWRGHFPERPLVRIPWPVEFLDSKTTLVAVQLADLMAGAARFALTEPESPDAAQFQPLIEPRCTKHCVYPQGVYIDTDLPQTELNIAVLAELGRRARAGLDPNYAIEVYIANAANRIEEAMGE
ncbi:MAG TPA: DUF3800 domain-containing protein [Acidimicrobiales bacterium]|nr:DUF3800 domain-containing protein [Acidimicrobiales bacterium]